MQGTFLVKQQLTAHVTQCCTTCKYSAVNVNEVDMSYCYGINPSVTIMQCRTVALSLTS